MLKNKFSASFESNLDWQLANSKQPKAFQGFPVSRGVLQKPCSAPCCLATGPSVPVQVQLHLNLSLRMTVVAWPEHTPMDGAV